MTLAFTLMCILVSGAFGAASLITTGEVALAAATIGLMTAWALAEIRRISWFAGFGFFSQVVIVGFAILEGGPESLFILTGVFCLAGWDLSAFRKRLSLAAEEDRTGDLESRHLSRLAFVLGAGGILAVMAVNVGMSLRFWPAVLLVGIGAVGMNQVFQWMRKHP